MNGNGTPYQPVVDPIAWLQDERDKPGSELSPDDLARFYAEQQKMMEQARKRAMNEYARGTGNVMQTTGNNPGLRLFMSRMATGTRDPFGRQPQFGRAPVFGRVPQFKGPRGAQQSGTDSGYPLSGFAKGGNVLSAKQRQALPLSSFALPGQGSGPKGAGSGSYPIPDASHARNALARVAQHGNPSQQARVRAAVHRKYPGIGKQ